MSNCRMGVISVSTLVILPHAIGTCVVFREATPHGVKDLWRSRGRTYDQTNVFCVRANGRGA